MIRQSLNPFIFQPTWRQQNPQTTQIVFSLKSRPHFNLFFRKIQTPIRTTAPERRFDERVPNRKHYSACNGSRNPFTSRNSKRAAFETFGNSKSTNFRGTFKRFNKSRPRKKVDDKPTFDRMLVISGLWCHFQGRQRPEFGCKEFWQPH